MDTRTKTFMTAVAARMQLQKLTDAYNAAILAQDKTSPAYGTFSRHDDPVPVLCRCGWIGRGMDMIHTYEAAGTDDLAPAVQCPQCTQDDYMDLRGHDLMAEANKMFPITDELDALKLESGIFGYLMAMKAIQEFDADILSIIVGDVPIGGTDVDRLIYREMLENNVFKHETVNKLKS